MKPLTRRALVLTAGVVLLYVWARQDTHAAAVESAFNLQQTRPVSTVSYNGQEFLSSFNSARDEARLVLVFSPT